jgi:hypothetical protein
MDVDAVFIAGPITHSIYHLSNLSILRVDASRVALKDPLSMCF